MCYTFAMQAALNVNLPSKPKSFRELLFILLSDQVAGFAIRLSFLLIVVLTGVIVAFYWRLPPEIPLFYSRPWGMEQLAPSYFLVVVFAMLSMILVVNTILASFSFSRERVLSRMFAWITLLVSFLVTYSVLRIVLLVT